MTIEVSRPRPDAAQKPFAETLIVDLGKASKKSIKNLRRGEGKLLDKVSRALADMQAEGVIDPAAQPVVIVVEAKKKKPQGFFGVA